MEEQSGEFNIVELAELHGFISKDNIVSEDKTQYSEYWIYELSKWMREVNRVYITIHCECCGDVYFYYDIQSDKEALPIRSDSRYHWPKYESCLFDALQHCLDIFDGIKDPIFKIK
jgi:hypothetical protein